MTSAGCLIVLQQALKQADCCYRFLQQDGYLPDCCCSFRADCFEDEHIRYSILDVFRREDYMFLFACLPATTKCPVACCNACGTR